jgi:hypothetical protein
MLFSDFGPGASLVRAIEFTDLHEGFGLGDGLDV